MGHESVRGALVNRLAEGMGRHVPSDEPVSEQELRTAAADLLTEPSAAAAVRAGLSEAHALGLSGVEGEPAFRDAAVNDAAREALIAVRPSLRSRFPVRPVVDVRLPIDGLSWLSGVRSLVDRFAVLSLAIAVVAFAGSFVLADEPTQVLRRAAWWIIGSAATWLVAASLFAALVRFTVPSSYAMVAAAVEIALRSMRNPALVMASFGVGMISIGFLAPAMTRRRGALLVDRAPGRPITSSEGSAATLTRDAAPDSSSPKQQAQVSAPSSTMARRLSAAWMEGHGYLDDARVAPFFSGSTRDS